MYGDGRPDLQWQNRQDPVPFLAAPRNAAAGQAAGIEHLRGKRLAAHRFRTPPDGLVCESSDIALWLRWRLPRASGVTKEESDGDRDRAGCPAARSRLEHGGGSASDRSARAC